MIFALLCGCEKAPNPENNENPPAPEYHESQPEESSSNNESNLIWLKLPHHLDEKFDSAYGIEPHSRRTDIPFPVPENYGETDSSVIPIDIPEELLLEIQKDYPDFTGKNGWNASVNYYTEDLSAGMIRIIYTIGGKITTNKAIICTIENNVIIRISYTNMEMETDEENLLERVEIFENTTTQERKILGEGEEFPSEDIQFNYYYNIDTLVYCYQLFFYVNTDMGKVVNNDYASEYIIDENGKPVLDSTTA